MPPGRSERTDGERAQAFLLFFFLAYRLRATSPAPSSAIDLGSGAVVVGFAAPPSRQFREPAEAPAAEEAIQASIDAPANKAPRIPVAFFIKALRDQHRVSPHPINHRGG